jgi:cytochrome c oxidase assembly protein subunit 16
MRPTPIRLGPFASKSFKSTLPNTIAARYRKALTKHPFLLFGLPFIATIVGGSFMLTPATALRYERYDRKNQQISQEERLGLGQNRRKVDMKDEYYVSLRIASGDWGALMDIVANGMRRGYKRRTSRTGNNGG